MTQKLPASLLLLACAAVGGCTSPLHLTYDFGRAYTEAFVAQADLTRPSVANSAYQLYGVEAADIRLRVRESSTDEETEATTLDNN